MKSERLLFILLLFNSVISFAQENENAREVRIPHYPPLTKPLTQKIEFDLAGKGMTSTSVSSGYYSPSGTGESGGFNTTVNLYTGSPELIIPVYTLSEGSLSVPIYLQYNAALIKPQSLSGWTGLGFELKGIPTINRVVRGLPDEGFLDNGVGRKGYYFWGSVIDPNDYYQDREPDYFFVETPSGSGRLVFDRYMNAHFSGNPDVKVKVNWWGNPHETGGTQITQQFTSFILTFPDGIKYTFDAQNNESSAEVEVKDAQSNSIYPGGSGFSDFLKYNLLTHTWYCSKIENQLGQKIDFEYERVVYSYFRTAEQTGINFCPVGDGMSKKINRVFVRASQIKEMKSNNLKIRFNHYNSSCYTDNSVSPSEEVCTYFDGSREDLDSWGNSPTSSTLGKRLNEIEISDNEISPIQKLTYHFEYDYFEGVETALPTGYSYSDIGTSHKKRLQLKTLTAPDRDTLSFTYASGTLPTRLTYGIDHWGWANGQESNLSNYHGLIGSQTYMDINNCGSNREPDFSHALRGVLTEVESSSGTKKSFEYEPHNLEASYSQVGGFRVKSVTDEDLINQVSTKKSYEYLNEDSSSSGLIFLEPRYRVIFELGGITTYYAHSNLFSTLLAESGRPDVAYQRVIEKTTTTGNNAMQGKIITEFNLDPTQGSTIGENLGSCTDCYDNPVYFNLLPDDTQGSIKNQKIYNQDNQLISKTSFDYDLIQYDSTYAYRTYRASYSSGGSSGYHWMAKNYYYPFYKYRLKSQTQTQYAPNGSGTPAINTVSYIYKDEMPQAYQEKYKGVHNMPVLISSTDEENNVNTSRILYVPDFNFDMDSIVVCPLVDPCRYDGTQECPRPGCESYLITPHVPPTTTEARGIFEALEKNIISIPVETETTINNNTIAAQYLKLTHEGIFNLGLPKTTYQLNNIPKNNFEGVYYDQANTAMVKDTDYQPVSEVLGYNNAGLTEQTKIVKGSTQKINYLNLTIPKGSTSNYGKSDALTEASEFDNIYLGANKLISPNLLEHKVIKDPQTGRVLQETDKNNHVLRKYEHHLDAGITAPEPFGWYSHSTSKDGNGDCVYDLKVKGLSSGGLAQFSFDGGLNFYNSNIPPDQMLFLFPPWSPTIQFHARDSNHPGNVISVTLNVCEP